MMKRKRTIFAIAGVGVIALVGVTFAVSQNSTILNNIFGVGTFETTFNEEFESPSNWATCETIDKEFTITNNSNVPAAVRVSLEEQWIAADGTTELPLVSGASNLQMAQINLKNNSGWTQSEGGNYYYYDVDLGANESTQTLLTGVTLNCDANLDTDGDSDYADATYHLKIKGEAIQADQKTAWRHEADCGSNVLYDKVACQTNGVDTNVDFTQNATVATGNGNGVNTFKAKADGQYPVYYYRGEVSNNNVIWAGQCWKIVRTTETGGVKLYYSGVADNGSCANADGNGITYENSQSFTYGYSQSSPQDVGYMYGTALLPTGELHGGFDYTFSNDVSYDSDSDTYTLDMSEGQYMTSPSWSDYHGIVAEKYHYFCTNKGTSCDSSQLRYVVTSDSEWDLVYMEIGRYGSIDGAMAALFSNNLPSRAKVVTETWFAINDTVNHEGDLEDTIFCNDRKLVSGSLAGKDSSARPMNSYGNLFAAYQRNVLKNSDNNYTPSLDCPNKNDAFTKDDVVKGNGKLLHKTGLITADELTLAGVSYNKRSEESYLNPNSNWTFTASPFYYFQSNNGLTATVFDKGANGLSVAGTAAFNRREINPMVSLKAGTTFANNGADGTKEHPYVIE